MGRRIRGALPSPLLPFFFFLFSFLFPVPPLSAVFLPFLLSLSFPFLFFFLFRPLRSPRSLRPFRPFVPSGPLHPLHPRHPVRPRPPLPSHACRRPRLQLLGLGAHSPLLPACPPHRSAWGWWVCWSSPRVAPPPARGVGGELRRFWPGGPARGAGDPSVVSVGRGGPPVGGQGGRWATRGGHGRTAGRTPPASGSATAGSTRSTATAPVGPCRGPRGPRG